jgi:hypothetical protein
MPDIHTDVSSNILKLGTLEIEAHADRLVVIQDEFRSGYECKTCRGRDIRKLSDGFTAQVRSVVPCDSCKGTGESRLVLVPGARCSHCEGKGFVVCPDCGGTGGVVAFAQDSERRPTTGTIASRGSEATKFERGESVIYPSFSGHAFDLTATDIHGKEVTVTIVILRESEVLARVRGHLELRRVKRSAAVGTAA